MASGNHFDSGWSAAVSAIRNILGKMFRFWGVIVFELASKLP